VPISRAEGGGRGGGKVSSRLSLATSSFSTRLLLLAFALSVHLFVFVGAMMAHVKSPWPLLI
jgi:hypothetical protein